MPNDYRQLVDKISLEEGVDPNLIHSIMRVESGFNPKAVSRAGAVGLMQLMPDTGRRFGVPEDQRDVPEMSIRGGAKYIKKLQSMFADPKHVLAAYNAGEGAVQQYGGIPPYPETQKYVEKVTSLLHPEAAGGATGGIEPILREQLAKTDPRQPIIQQELRIRGLNPDEVAQQLSDPARQDQVFFAALKRAEAANPQLRMSAGFEAYTTALKDLPSGAGHIDLAKSKEDIDKERLAKGLEEKSPKNFFPRSLGQIIDIPIQLAKGLTIDVTSLGIELAKDVVGATTGVDVRQGNQPDSAFGISYDVGKDTLSEIADKFLGPLSMGEAKTGLASIGRSIATLVKGFHETRAAIQRQLTPPKGLAEFASKKPPEFVERAAVNVAAGATTGFAFVDPNSSLMSGHFDQIARSVDPEGPESTRALFTRAITGEESLTSAKARLAQRLLRAGEDAAATALLEPLFEVVSVVHNSWKVNRALAALEKANVEARATAKAEATRAAAEAPLTVEPLSTTGSSRQQLLHNVDPDLGTPIVPPTRTAPQYGEATTFRAPSTGATAEEVAAYQERIAMQRAALKEPLPEIPRGTPIRGEATPVAVPQAGASKEEVASYIAKVADQRALYAAQAENVTRTTALMEQVTAAIAKPATGTATRSTKWMQSLIDDIQGEATHVTETGLPRVPPPSVPLNFPSSLPEEALHGADELFKLVGKPLAESGLTSQLHQFLSTLKEQFGTDTGKTLVVALLQGGLGAGAGKLLLDAEEGGPADYAGVDRQLIAGAALLFGAGLGGRSFRGATMALRALRGEVVPELRSAIAEIKLGPSVRQRVAGESFLGGETNVLPVFRGTGRPRFELVNDQRDLRAMVTEATAKSGTTSRLVDVGNDTEVALKLGIQANSVNDARRLAGGNAEAFGKRAAALVQLADQMPSRLRDLAKRYQAGEPVATELLRNWSIAGELGNGFRTESRQFGASMDRFRAGGYGEFTQIVSDGIATGTRQPSTATTDRIARWIATTPDEGLMAAAHHAVTANGGDAVVQAFLNTLTGTITTPMKAAIGNTTALAMEIAETGMVANGYRTPGLRLLMGERQIGTPEVGDALAMFNAVKSSVMEGIGVAARTALTGRTVFSEAGATHSLGPAFTREAFPRAARALDAGGEFVGLPNAGNVFNYLGTLSDVLGSRALVAVDEFTSFVAERAALAGQEHRFIVQSQRAGLKGDALEQAVAEFRVRPPDNVVASIKRLKKEVTFMDDMMNEYGAFGFIRHTTGALNNVISESTTARLTFPFLRAMTGIFTNTAEHTFGLNLLSKQFWNELQSVDPFIKAHAQGRLMMSGVLASTFATAGAAGLIIGSVTNDKNYREELTRAGRAPNSIYIGGVRYGLDTQQVLGSIANLFATLGMAARDDATPAEVNAWHGGILAIQELLKNETFAGRLVQLAGDFEDRRLMSSTKKQGVAETAVQLLDDVYLHSVVPPRLVQQFRQVLDPYKRVYDGELEKVRARTPFLSDNAKQETDIFLRPRYLGGGLSSSTVDNVGRIVTGVPIESLAPDALSTVLTAKGIIIKDPPASISHGPITVTIDNEEQQRLRELIGHPPGLPPLQDALMEMSRTEFWKQASPGPDGVADLMVKRVVSQYTAVAKQMLLAERTNIGQRLIEKGKQTGFIPIQGVQ